MCRIKIQKVGDDFIIFTQQLKTGGCFYSISVTVSVFFFFQSESRSINLTHPLRLRLFVPELPLPPRVSSAKSSQFQPSLVLNVSLPPPPTSPVLRRAAASYRSSINHLVGKLRRLSPPPLSLSPSLPLSIPYCLSFVSYLPK